MMTCNFLWLSSNKKQKKAKKRKNNYKKQKKIDLYMLLATCDLVCSSNLINTFVWFYFMYSHTTPLQLFQKNKTKKILN